MIVQIINPAYPALLTSETTHILLLLSKPDLGLTARIC
jgi:hypothetical protein